MEQFNYYKQKQNKVLYVNMDNMEFLPPTVPIAPSCPQPRFRAYTLYYLSRRVGHELSLDILARGQS